MAKKKKKKHSATKLLEELRIERANKKRRAQLRATKGS
jgi:hypothetical protein